MTRATSRLFVNTVSDYSEVTVISQISYNNLIVSLGDGLLYISNAEILVEHFSRSSIRISGKIFTEKSRKRTAIKIPISLLLSGMLRIVSDTFSFRNSFR